MASRGAILKALARNEAKQAHRMGSLYGPGPREEQLSRWLEKTYSREQLFTAKENAFREFLDGMEIIWPTQIELELLWLKEELRYTGETANVYN